MCGRCLATNPCRYAEKDRERCPVSFILTRTCRVRGHHAFGNSGGKQSGVQVASTWFRGNDDAIRTYYVTGHWSVARGPMDIRWILELAAGLPGQGSRGRTCQTGPASWFRRRVSRQGALPPPLCRAAGPRLSPDSGILRIGFCCAIFVVRLHRIASSLLLPREACLKGTFLSRLPEADREREPAGISGLDKVHGNLNLRPRAQPKHHVKRS